MKTLTKIVIYPVIAITTTIILYAVATAFHYMITEFL